MLEKMAVIGQINNIIVHGGKLTIKNLTSLNGIQYVKTLPQSFCYDDFCLEKNMVLCLDFLTTCTLKFVI